VVPAGVGERPPVDVGDVRREGGPELGLRARSLGDQRPGQLEGRAELRVPAQLGVEDGRHEGARQQAVVGRDQVDGSPQGDDPDDLPGHQEPGELSPWNPWSREQRPT
jgi:hypothetical protein